jgi:hypothetical protein
MPVPPRTYEIKFYRTREKDDAHAVVERISFDADGVGVAIEHARLLMRTLNMPQRPDRVTLTDNVGATVFSGTFIDLSKGDESS